MSVCWPAMPRRPGCWRSPGHTAFTTRVSADSLLLETLRDLGGDTWTPLRPPLTAPHARPGAAGRAAFLPENRSYLSSSGLQPRLSFPCDLANERGPRPEEKGL